MNAHATLTRDSVVNQLVAQLVARQTLAARRSAAYHRLAEYVLGTADPVTRSQLAPKPIAESLKNAA